MRYISNATPPGAVRRETVKETGKSSHPAEPG